jgi:hypothetical protein
METWAVAWERDGVRYLLDIDDRAGAFALAVQLAEQGRGAVRVMRVPYEVDPEVRDRVRRRIEERIRAEGGRHADA